jgi:hypothetical protein
MKILPDTSVSVGNNLSDLKGKRKAINKAEGHRPAKEMGHDDRANNGADEDEGQGRDSMQLFDT